MRTLIGALLIGAAALSLAGCVNGQAGFDTSTLQGAVTVGGELYTPLCKSGLAPSLCTKQDKKIAKGVEQGVNSLPSQ